MSEIVPYRSGGYVPPRDVGSVAPGYPEGYPDAQSSTPGIREYAAIVRRQLWIVLAVLIVVVGPTVYGVMQTPPRYRAVSTIRLADDSRKALAGDYTNPYDVVGRETDILQSQIQILNSQAVGAEAVDLEGLRLRPAAGSQFVDELAAIRVAENATTDSVRLTFGPTSVVASTARSQATAAYGQPLQIDGVSFVVAQKPAIQAATMQVVSRDAAIGEALGGFSANPRPKTDIIDLSYVGLEPHQARRLTNAMAKAFQAHNAATSQLESKRRRIFLEGQLKQTDSMLNAATFAYSNYRSRQQVFSSKEKASAEEQNLVAIDMKRAELDAERRTYESLLSQAQRSGNASDANLRRLVSLPGIASNPVVEQLYGQLTTLETTRDNQLSAGAAATNPDLISVNGRIATTSDRLFAAVRGQIEALKARIQAMDDLRANSSTKLGQAPATESEEAQLSQQVQTIQKMSEGLQSELQKAKMSEAVEAGQVEIVDLATVPYGPIPSGSTRKVALGVIVALLAGIGLAVVIDGMNTSIRRRTDIERVLQVPGLAVIPRLARGTPLDRGLQRALPSKAAGNGRIKPTKKKSSLQELVTVTDMRSASAEAYRTLRTNLIFSQSVQTLRTVVVTSASPGEGKTTTAANLAVSFAHHGMRVLLIDCDLRRGRVHKIFEIPRDPGITELVLGREEAETVIKQTTVTGLYVISSGNLPPNPSELLGGDRMRKILTSLSEGFDLIIVDTPPLLAASDGAILSTLADGVVVVLRAGSTESDAAQQAIQQLMGVGARVVGAVLNDPDAKVPTYGGYYHYEYAGANE
ncbi:MAG TPA: polysaccharide biosynthesis tyrosine autokinase [Gemmatimonadaceae bacterium]|nr:polysaccharide biosynthesis tyrosine autokinase [Gemmatimonadaceae bacterium]